MLALEIMSAVLQMCRRIPDQSYKEEEEDFGRMCIIIAIISKCNNN
jgi:hypothetical protein